MSIINNSNFWTFIGTISGLIALYFTFKTHNQKADIFLTVSSKYADLTDKKLHLNFTNNLSQAFLVNFSILNQGNKNTNSIHLSIVFNSQVIINSSPKTKEGWKDTSSAFSNFKSFSYVNDTKQHSPKTNFNIGKFELSIPQLNQLNSNKYFIATGVIEGNFKSSCFLLLYDLFEDILIIKRFTGLNINFGNDEWNLMLRENKEF